MVGHRDLPLQSFSPVGWARFLCPRGPKPDAYKAPDLGSPRPHPLRNRISPLALCHG